MIGVYHILNKVSGKRYIGSSIDIYNRLETHKRQLRKGSHSNQKLQRAFNCYSEDGFLFEQIVVCSKKDRLFYEKALIDGYDAVNEGYNISKEPSAFATGLHWKLSKETRRKQSEARKGIRHTPEVIERISRSNRGVKRGPHSEETKRKISDALKGRPQHPNSSFLGKTHTAETRAKCPWNRGLKMPDSFCEKQRIVQKGKIMPESAKQKIREAHTGRVHTEEAKRNMSLAHEGKPWSAARRAAFDWAKKTR